MVPDVGIDNYLMPPQRCTEHAVKFQDSIDLFSTDDPCIGEKVTRD